MGRSDAQCDGPLIPSETAGVIARRFGPEGETFVLELRDRLAAAMSEWQLSLREPLPVGIGGYLVAVATSAGTDAVLKLAPTGPVNTRVIEREAYALGRWEGDGAVRLLGFDGSRGALLLERCLPGDTIDMLADGEMVTAGCQLARRLHRVADAEDQRTLSRANDEVARRLTVSMSS